MTVVTKLEVEKTKEVPILKIDEKVVKRQFLKLSPFTIHNLSVQNKYFHGLGLWD